jgi:hypothetical protein
MNTHEQYVFKAVKIHMIVFWVMPPCILVDGYQSIGEHTASFFRV